MGQGRADTSKMRSDVGTYRLCCPQRAERLFHQTTAGARERYEILRTVEEQMIGDELRQLADLDYRVRHGESLGVGAHISRARVWDSVHSCMATRRVAHQGLTTRNKRNIHSLGTAPGEASASPRRHDFSDDSREIAGGSPCPPGGGPKRMV